MEKGRSFLNNGDGKQLYILTEKENLNLFLTSSTVNLRCITNINMKGKTINLPEENTREYLQDLRRTFSSVAQSCPTLCDPMNCSMPGLPVHHQLPESTQTHVHWVGDAIQPSHPLSSPCPPALNLSQHQGLFKWVSSSHQVAKVLGVSTSTSVLPMNTQDWSPLGWTGWISSQSKGLSRVFSNTTVQKHQFFCAQLSLQSNSHIHTWPLEKP